MPILTRSAIPVRPAFREEKPLMVDFVYNKGEDGQVTPNLVKHFFRRLLTRLFGRTLRRLCRRGLSLLLA